MTRQAARELFAPLASGYERWAQILSMGQDERWRRTMVEGLAAHPGDRALDLAAGTGSITRLLQNEGATVVSLDLSPQMLEAAVGRGAVGVLAEAEWLPFAEDTFDLASFGYLLRYVSDVEGCLKGITRVLRPGGRVGMVEFGRPRGLWWPPWWLYTRVGLPVAGLFAGPGWAQVGSFLGPSIEDFADTYPDRRLIAAWEAAGLTEVRLVRLSLGGGMVMWGRKPDG